MRTSAFVRPAEVHYITLHEDLYRICRGNACAAMLMDYFIREHDRRLWEGRVRMDGPHDMPGCVEKWSMTIQASVEFLCDILVWSYSKNSISDAMKKLSEWGMIKIAKDRPKGREYDRRHYLTVNQDEVQRLFTQLASGVLSFPKTESIDLPKLGNQSAEIGKSLEEMKLVTERGRETVAAEAAPLPPQELRSLEAIPLSPTPNSAHPPSTPLAKPTPKPRPRNLLGEAMLEVCWGISDYTKATKEQWSLAVKAINGIKEVQPDLSPEMIRQFAAQKRREWDGASFSPGAFLKHWRPVSSAASGIPEEDPFPGKITVTLADVAAKFGNGQVCSMWVNRLRASGRMR